MIKVLFFAQLREQLDCSEMAFTWREGLNLADLLEDLGRQHPEWQAFLSGPKLLMAVNQTMVNGDTHLSDGDEVAFFPPVTGG